MALVWKVDESSKVNLKDYDPNYTDKYSDHALVEEELQKLGDELSKLQEFLAAAYEVINHEQNALIYTDEDLLFLINEKLSPR